MADTLLRGESPTEFFRELVEAAMQNQRVSAHELTSFYVVNLLTGFVHADARAGDGPLGGACGGSGPTSQPAAAAANAGSARSIISAFAVSEMRKWLGRSKSVPGITSTSRAASDSSKRTGSPPGATPQR